MTFLNPLFLLGLAAAAIPLIIHLFNFRRPRRVDFSSLAFLHELKKSTMQRVRIKQWLLLAIRTLAIAFLALAFARPTLRGDLAGVLGGRGQAATAVVIDNSTSMTLRDGSGAFIEQARTIAATLLEDMESGDETRVIPVQGDSGPVPVYQTSAPAREELLSIEAADGARPLDRAVRDAAALVRQSPSLNRIVYVLSDFQRSTLTSDGDDPPADSLGDVDVVLIPVGTEPAGNVAVTGVRAVSQIIAEDQPATLEADFLNAGGQDVSGLVASLFLGDERVAQASVDIPAGSTARAEFVVTPRSRGWLRGRVEIDDTPYENDNVRRFALHVPEERSVLIAGGTDEAARYLNLALSPELTGDRIRFEVRSIPESGLAGEQLGAYDVVVLSGVADLSSGERAALAQYVTAGGGLLLFPGPDMRLDDYNALVGALGGGRFTGRQDASARGTNAVLGTFGRVDTEHPLFEGMFEPDPSGRTPTLEQPAIFRLTAYQPGGGNEQSLITLTGGEPFLHEIRAGEGAVLLSAVGASVRDSDLPVRGLFIPLIYRSVYYLSATGSTTGESVPAGEPLTLRLSGLESDADVRVLSGAGEEFIPVLRRVPGAILAELEGPFFTPGFYEIRAADELQRLVVVHPAAAESNLDLLDRSDLDEAFAGATGIEGEVLSIELTDDAALRTRLRQARTGVELWNVFLAIALGLLLVEMLVARQFRPESAHG